MLERTMRYELAPLTNGTYRRRTLSEAFEQTWSSLMQFDSLAAPDTHAACDRVIAPQNAYVHRTKGHSDAPLSTRSAAWCDVRGPAGRTHYVVGDHPEKSFG